MSSFNGAGTGSNNTAVPASGGSGAAPGNAAVTASVSAVYAGGNFLPIDVADLMTSPTAVSQLVNQHNALVRERDALRDEVSNGKEKLAALSLQPVLASFVGLCNVAGVILVGIGAGWVSATSPPKGSGWILTAGIILCLAASVAVVAVPLIQRARKGN